MSDEEGEIEKQKAQKKAQKAKERLKDQNNLRRESSKLYSLAKNDRLKSQFATIENNSWEY